MKNRLITLTSFIVIIWISSFIVFLFHPNYILPVLIPRTAQGLLGILTMPFIHGSITHLVANTLPFIIFSWLILIRGTVYYLKATTIILILGGLLVWLFARSAAHIGASGLIFGYFGFLIARAFYDRSIRSVLITLLVFFFYGGFIWGIVPTAGRISWEAHLFGMIAGIIAARYVKHNMIQDTTSE